MPPLSFTPRHSVRLMRDGQETVDHLESVLAYVAGDATNQGVRSLFALDVAKAV